MTRRSVMVQRILLLCILVGVALLLAFSRITSQPALSIGDVVGMWRSSAGGQMEFLSSQKFQASDLRLGQYSEPDCPDWSGSGTWQFASGNTLDIALTSPSSSSRTSVAGCFGMVEFTSWKSHSLAPWDLAPPLSLCLSVDPDSPCAGYVFTRP